MKEKISPPARAQAGGWNQFPFISKLRRKAPIFASLQSSNAIFISNSHLCQKNGHAELQRMHYHKRLIDLQP